MKKLFFWPLVASISFMACTENANRDEREKFDQTEQANKAQDYDPNSFATQASMGNMMEIRSSHLITKSENPEVQKLAAMLLDEHGKAQAELEKIAKNEQIHIPLSLPPAKQSMIMRMDSLKGANRDNQYVELMVTEHELAVPLYKEAVAKENNPKLKAFAKDKLPKLQQHLVEAKALLQKLGNQTNSSRAQNNSTGS
jgi:putative membrane protein